jgi:polar amino acid transport system substrate-binding protein
VTVFSPRPVAKTAPLLAAAALTLALTATGCSGSGVGTAQGIHLVRAGTLTVCTHLPYKPFEYTNREGDVVGFDVDLTGLLATSLGVKQKIVDVDWNQVTSGAAFKAGRCDVGEGAMTITPERQRSILISEPYFNATQALLTRTDSGVRSVADLGGKKVGVQTDTTGEIYGTTMARKHDFTTVTFDDVAAEANAVKAGRVDAAINDNEVLYDFVRSNPDTAVVQEFNTGERYGFAAEKDDSNATRLMSRLDDVLDRAKTDGTMDKLFEKWFGTFPGSVNG